MNEELINILNSLIATSTPLVIAAIGEMISERAGVVNLSLDGSLQLAAVIAVIAALAFGSPFAGLLAAMIVGALVALVIVVADVELKQNQVAIGFVLFLLTGSLAQFLGQGYTASPPPTVPYAPIPLLRDIPAIGKIFFTHNLLVYVGYILIFASWWWIFRTRGGLAQRAIGERPEAAFARGTNVNRLRLRYALIGGALVGLAGAAYSLAIKVGWSNPPAMRGDGWIALAIVIFGGWHPFRVVFGAYLFAFLRVLTTIIQRSPDINIPLVLVNALPWLLMIATLLLVSTGAIERLLPLLPQAIQKPLRGVLRSDPPAALGTRFEES